MNHMDNPQPWRLETLALHGDPALGPTAGAEALPIHQTAAFHFKSPEEAAARFGLEELGPLYTRIGNPTVDAFERRMAALEGGIGAVATASGQAATFYAIATITQQGDNVVASASLYGGVYSLLKNQLLKFGIQARFVPVHDLSAWEAAIDSRTTCLYAEMIGNPLLDTPDLEALAHIASRHGIPLIIDNTVATACLCRPFEYGASVVVYSATKYVGGHGTTIGGCIIDSGQFDWGSGRFPQFSQPDEIYGGMRLAKRFGPMAYLVKMRGHWLRDVGACMAPMTAWNLVQGVQTLPVRMERHCDNAGALAEWLEADPRVERVLYPGCMPAGSPSRRYLRRGGGMLGLYLRGGDKAARRFVQSTKIFTHAANMGDCRSLVIHPASTTHALVAPDVRCSLGIDDNYLRVSVGLEHVEDLKADLDAALGG
jgi:O-acetylhomoserine (thiol)-lyase